MLIRVQLTTSKWRLLAVDIREFTKPRRRRQRQHRLKNEFIFYLRISRYYKVIYFVCHRNRAIKQPRSQGPLLQRPQER